MAKPYEKYKEKLKKHCVLGIISAIVVMISLFAMFFVPFLKADILPGISVNYSLFDISKDALTPREGVSVNWQIIISILFFSLALLACVMDIGRNISYFVKTEDKLLHTYDILRTRTYKDAKAILRQASTITLSMLLIIHVMVLMTLFLSSPSTEEYASLLVYCVTGVNVMILFPLISLIAVLVLVIVRGVLDRRIRTAILQDNNEVLDKN